MLVLLVRGSPSLAALAGVSLAAQAIPLASIYRMAVGWPRRTMVALATVLAGLAVLGAITIVLDPDQGGGAGLMTLALVGAFLSTWASNFLAMARPRR
jgi:hypothetical protein